MPGSEQDVHHTPAPANRRHGLELHRNGGGARTKSPITPEGLGCKTVYLPPCL
jgi:hypothetical protein